MNMLSQRVHKIITKKLGSASQGQGWRNDSALCKVVFILKENNLRLAPFFEAWVREFLKLKRCPGIQMWMSCPKRMHGLIQSFVLNGWRKCVSLLSKNVLSCFLTILIAREVTNSKKLLQTSNGVSWCNLHLPTS